MDIGERVGHTLVLGTTRVGKTRLAEILITQDIRRGDVVIVFDPKGMRVCCGVCMPRPNGPDGPKTSICSIWDFPGFRLATTPSATSRASPRLLPASPTSCL